MHYKNYNRTSYEYAIQMLIQGSKLFDLTEEWCFVDMRHCYHKTPEEAEDIALKYREKYPDNPIRVLRIETRKEYSIHQIYGDGNEF